jgi:hypothetical protein
VRSIYPTLSVLGLGEREPVFRLHAACVLSFMHPESEQVRKLALQTLQVNIARNQVNVAETKT